MAMLLLLRTTFEAPYIVRKCRVTSVLKYTPEEEHTGMLWCGKNQRNALRAARSYAEVLTPGECVNVFHNGDMLARYKRTTTGVVKATERNNFRFPERRLVNVLYLCTPVNRPCGRMRS